MMDKKYKYGIWAQLVIRYNFNFEPNWEEQLWVTVEGNPAGDCFHEDVWAAVWQQVPWNWGSSNIWRGSQKENIKYGNRFKELSWSSIMLKGDPVWLRKANG
jgi:hypothetical protein